MDGYSMRHRGDGVISFHIVDREVVISDGHDRGCELYELLEEFSDENDRFRLQSEFGIEEISGDDNGDLFPEVQSLLDFSVESMKDDLIFVFSVDVELEWDVDISDVDDLIDVRVTEGLDDEVICFEVTRDRWVVVLNDCWWLIASRGLILDFVVTLR